MGYGWGEEAHSCSVEQGMEKGEIVKKKKREGGVEGNHCHAGKLMAERGFWGKEEDRSRWRSDIGVW